MSEVALLVVVVFVLAAFFSALAASFLALAASLSAAFLLSLQLFALISSSSLCFFFNSLSIFLFSFSTWTCFFFSSFPSEDASILTSLVRTRAHPVLGVFEPALRIFIHVTITWTATPLPVKVAS